MLLKFRSVQALCFEILMPREKSSLVITSIAGDDHPVLNRYAKKARTHDIQFILIGDTKSPSKFKISNCDYYSIHRQIDLRFELPSHLPFQHYSRKNIGYLVAIKNGADIIIETDDDNIPMDNFWNPRKINLRVRPIKNGGWVNIYKYFTDVQIWPRGFNLENILDPLPKLGSLIETESPIQQGLADENPDVDAIYRLTMPLPIIFKSEDNISLGINSICPFNSQNTTWFKEAFPLLYLPSNCSFRMTDIWRSFVAQRIAWACGWSIVFHSSTVRQERNGHSLIKDFEDEVVGYLNNSLIASTLTKLPLKEGKENIYENLELCYKSIIKLGVIDQKELPLVKAWINDIQANI